ncbi:MAG: pectinesterase family protein [Gillisia sp.]|nr:pectinesterase family protein [Gillisia sp.]
MKPEGRHNWGKKNAETTAFYGEYNSTREGANSNNRASWPDQAKKISSKKTYYL